jgi:hypothetical protein
LVGDWRLFMRRQLFVAHTSEHKGYTTSLANDNGFVAFATHVAASTWPLSKPISYLLLAAAGVDIPEVNIEHRTFE